MNTISFFDSNGDLREGVVRREDLGGYILATTPDGRRWLITKEEVCRDGDEQIRTEEQKVQESPSRRKRGRPRKLGL